MSKTSHWNYVRSKIKREFERKGITTCELGLPGCWRNNALSFCHRLKRRKITDDTELKYCALACVPCHSQIECLPADEMYRIVTETVENRDVT